MRQILLHYFLYIYLIFPSITLSKGVIIANPIIAHQLIKTEPNQSSDQNSILLFDKELIFGITLDEFKVLFDEFKPEANDFFFGTNGEGFELYSIRKENKEDAFKGHWIVAKFKNGKLNCMEFHGSNTEINKITSTILSQFTLYDKKITNEEMEIETIYYKKDDMKAELVQFESTLLTICMVK